MPLFPIYLGQDKENIMPRQIPPSLFTSRYQFDKGNSLFHESFGPGQAYDIKNGLPLDRDNHVFGRLISEQEMNEIEADKVPSTEVLSDLNPAYQRPVDIGLKKQLPDGTKANVSIQGDKTSIRMYGKPKTDKIRPNEVILTTGEDNKVIAESHIYEVMENGTITQSYVLDYDPDSGKLINAIHINEKPEAHEPSTIHAAFMKGKPVEIKEFFADENGNVGKTDNRTPQQIQKWNKEKRNMGKPLYCYNRKERMKHATVDVSKAAIINGTAYTIAKTIEKKGKVEKDLIKRMAKPTRTPSAHDLSDQEAGALEITLNVANKAMKNFSTKSMQKIHELSWLGPKRSKKRPVQLPAKTGGVAEQAPNPEVARAQERGLLNSPESIKADESEAVQTMPTSFDNAPLVKDDLQGDVEKTVVAHQQLMKQNRAKSKTGQR